MAFHDWVREVQRWHIAFGDRNIPQDSRGWEGYYQNGLTPEQATRQDIDSEA